MLQWDQQWINLMILHDKTKQEFGYEFTNATIRSEFYCICDYCGIEFKRCKKTILQCNKVLNKDSCGIGICKKSKSEEVNLIKYGVTNVGGTPEKLEKRKNTSLKKYHSESYSSSEECKKNNQEKYGVDFPIQLEEVKFKVKQHHIEKYGVDHHTKSIEYQNKRRERQLAKSGVIHHSKTKEFKEKLRNTFLEKYGKDSIFHTEHFQKLISSNRNFNTTENEIKDFLSSLGFSFNIDRSLLEGKEIDLLNNELKLGIEYCGLYWHHEFSPQPRNRSYHFDKYQKCLIKNIKLITIFEDEWKLKKQQCKSILKANLQKFDRTIYARKCVVKEIDKEVFMSFCDNYHLQGKCNSLVRFGIFYENDLLGVMSLGKHHRLNKDVVLNRLCFKTNVQILGGASKLFSHCVNWCENKYKKIITWSDNRWSSGKVYEKMGFFLEKNLPPDYSYVLIKGGYLQRLSKQSCKKSCKDCPSDITEREWMANLGYARIWDCGKKRWVFNLGTIYENN